jgi:flagellar basal-body rod protein FlgB
VIDLYSRLGPLERVLDFHAARHGVIAANVANADTPGFVPRELDFRMVVERGGPPGGPVATRTHATATVVDAPDGPAGTDGNRVRLDRQLARLAANSVRYESAAEIIARRLALLRYAAADGMGR